MKVSTCPSGLTCPPGGGLLLAPLTGSCPPSHILHVPYSVKVSACPSGLTCPPGGVSACPTDWVLSARHISCVSHTPSLFAVRDIFRYATCTVDITGSCLYPDLSPFLSPFTRSVLICISYTLWVCLYPGISPLGKKLCITVMSVQKFLKIGHKLSKNNHWIPLYLTPC